MSNKETAATSHTYLVHDEPHAEGAVSPPIYQTSLFTFKSYEEMEARFKGQSDRALYSRIDNPTVTALLQKLCLLEGGDKAIAFASGIAAFLLAAVIDVSGGLDKLLNAILSKTDSVISLTAASLASGATMVALTRHGGVTALIVGGLFQKAHREHNLAPANLSRSLEDSVTTLEPLMPRTVSAIFMTTTLGVPTLEYLPWTIFCMTGWMFSLLLAAFYQRTGFGLKPL